MLYVAICYIAVLYIMLYIAMCYIAVSIDVNPNTYHNWASYY